MRKQSAAVHTIIQMLMGTVTMKKEERIGMNANRKAIALLAFTEGAAMDMNAWNG